MNEFIPKIRFNKYFVSWEKHDLGNCVSYIKGFAFKSEDYRSEGIRIIRVSDLSADTIKTENKKRFLDKKNQKDYIKYELNIGDIIITTVGSKAEMKDSAVGRPIIVNKKVEGLLNQNLVKIFPLDKSNSYFIYGNLLKENYINYIALIERGNANQANIAINDLWKYIVYLASPEEQEKIGDFFQLLDETIILQQQLLNDHKQLKEAMLQKIFPQKGETVPKFRFANFTDEWKEYKSKDIFCSISDKNHPDLPVLSASQQKGMIYRSDINIDIQYNKESTKTYKRVIPGQFVIHLRSFQGGFAYSNIEGITSPAYTVIDFKCKDSQKAMFWKHILTSNSFIKTLETITYGIRDGRSISFSEFSTLKFRVPSYDEQYKISTFFDRLDSLIASNQKKLETYQELKKAMLQKMFV